VRSVLFVGGLSFAIAVVYVVAAGLAPTGQIATGPFANLHGGLPAGLPAYVPQVQGSPGGSSGEGRFEWNAQTPDETAKVLHFYEQNIDGKTWTVTGSGDKTISFYYRAAPGIRGGVVASDSGRSTFITLWMTDLKLPAGYPLDFPSTSRARPMGAPTNVAGVFTARWDVGSVGAPGTFVDDFAQVLADSGWDVTARRTTRETPGLQCRSRSSPLVTCAVTTKYEITNPSTSRVVYDAVGTFVATVRVGQGADR